MREAVSYARAWGLELGHRLLCFLLRLHVDAKIGKMEGELRINLAIVASIIIYV